MARTHGTKELWLEALRADGPAFLAALKEAEPATPVPSCPGWTAVDLAHHLGSVYRWVNMHVVRGMTDKPDRSYSDVAAEPAAPDPVDWCQAQLSALIGTLEVLDPEMPAWNWAPRAKNVAFWQRRMAWETTVHRWDAQMAIGRAEPVDLRFAVDGVSEVVDTWLPAGRRIGRTDAQGVVALQATDADQAWHLRLRGEGFALLDTDTIFDDDDVPARALAAGSASDVMLALWGRVAFDALDVSGDETLLDALRVGR